MNNFYKHKRLYLQVGIIVGIVLSLLAYGVLYITEIPLTFESIYLSFCLSSIGGLTVALVLFYINKSKNTAFENLEVNLLKENECLLLEGAANRHKRKVKTGGKLVLTDRRIIFATLHNNVEIKYVHFPLIDIEQISRTKVAGLINSGFKLVSNGNTICFSVDYANDWYSFINLQMAKSKSEKMIVCTH